MDSTKKTGRYQRILKQLEELLQVTENKTAKMSTVAAIVYHKMDSVFWAGFYILQEEELIVGPYQGPVACQILKKDTGVCWAGITRKKNLIVPDVEKFPGHIACDSRSKSEIVLPLRDNKGDIYAVMDLDSKELNAFDDTDRLYLEKIIKLI